MLSKKEKDKYVVLEEEFNKFPYELDKKETDEALEKIIEALKTLDRTMLALYRSENQYPLYHLLTDALNYKLDFDEGSSWGLEWAIENVTSIQQQLAEHDDVIPEPEEIVDLEDLGFKLFDRQKDIEIWQKIVRDDDEAEFAEEVVIRDKKADEAVYRRREIFWEKTGYSKHSKAIYYLELEKNDDVKLAIRNTVRKVGKGEEIEL